MQAIEDGGDTQNFSSNLVGNVILSTDSLALASQAQRTEVLRSWHTHGTYLSIAAFLLLFNVWASRSPGRRKLEKRVATWGAETRWLVVATGETVEKLRRCNNFDLVDRFAVDWSNRDGDIGKISVLIVISRPNSAWDGEVFYRGFVKYE